MTSVYLATPFSQEKVLACLRVHSEPESGSVLLESEDTLVHVTAPVLRVFAILLSALSAPNAGLQVADPLAMVIVYTVLDTS